MSSLKQSREILSEIKKYSRQVKTPAGRFQKEISLAEIKKIARNFSCSTREVEIIALEERIVPSRYARNIGTIGLAGQAKLLKSRAAVVGAGGIGGTVVELLARMGVGEIVVIDGQTFEENNLNRQLLATENTIGKLKAETAAEKIKEINSSVKVICHPVKADKARLLEFLKGADVVVDALDSIETRHLLQEVTRELKIPFVYGTIAGFFGQVMTIFPEDKGLELVYGEEGLEQHKGVEVSLGNPSATPAMIAAWQVQEVIKVILKIGLPLRNRLLVMDAAPGRVEIIELDA